MLSPKTERKSNLRFYLLIIIAGLIFSMLFGWVRDFFGGEEARIKKFILRGKTAFEAKDILGCNQLISSEYRDKYGNDSSSLLYYAREAFRHYAELFAQIQHYDIKLSEDKLSAQVEIEATVIGLTKENSRENIFESEKGKFKIRLIKEDKSWKLLELEFYESLSADDEYTS